MAGEASTCNVKAKSISHGENRIHSLWLIFSFFDLNQASVQMVKWQQSLVLPESPEDIEAYALICISGATYI
jgi:hypothetical protein